MQSKAATVAEYIKSLPDDRRAGIETLRKVIADNIDPILEEGMQYGMIGYYVPHSAFPAGYHCDPKQPLPYAGLASQKGHLSLYLMGLYADEKLSTWFKQAWAKTGKKLDMGAACVRIKKIEDVPLDLVGEAFRKLTANAYIAQYQKLLATRGGAQSPTKKSAGKKVAKKAPAKAAKTAGKKVAKKTKK